MLYSSTPVSFKRDEISLSLQIDRSIQDPIAVIDNWVDTIVFTATRRFKADEDFGFSFWDNEFIAMNLNDFNNGIDYKVVSTKGKSEQKQQMSSAGIRVCEQSIVNSIRYYVPYLKDINVTVSLSYERDQLTMGGRGENSKYVVRVHVRGRTSFNEFSGTREGEYRKDATFFMDPFLNNK